MTIRRSLVLVAASVAALTMSGEALAAPAAPGDADQGRRVAGELTLPSATPRAAAEGPSMFTPMAPLRVLDTRSGSPVGQRGMITLDLAGLVPETTTAVVLNLTGVAPTAGSFVTAWPAGQARPTVSNLNLAAGEIRANAVTVAVSPDLRVNLYNHNGNINLVADLAGFYAIDGATFYNSRSPQRVLDTRGGSPIPDGGTITVDISAFLASSGATAVTLNLTVVSPTTSTFLTAYPTGTSRPTASSINVARGAVTANQVTVALGADKNIRLFNNSGNSHVLVDLVGHYDTLVGDLFIPTIPERVFDTRDLGPGGALQGGSWYMIYFATSPEDPFTVVTGMALNLTGINGTSSTFLTVYPGDASRPNASTINLAAGQTAANAATSRLGWDFDDSGQYYGFKVYNHAGQIHFAVDSAGIFVSSVA